MLTIVIYYTHKPFEEAPTVPLAEAIGLVIPLIYLFIMIYSVWLHFGNLWHIFRLNN